MHDECSDLVLKSVTKDSTMLRSAHEQCGLTMSLESQRRMQLYIKKPKDITN